MPAPWSVCILNRDGEIMVHRAMKASPEPFLQAIAPSREEMVVAVECLLTWYWRADLGAQEGLRCVLGHARAMNAIHGGQANNDQIDAQNIAVLRRGGMLPQASVYPALNKNIAYQATRDGLAQRFADPAVQPTIEVDLALMGDSDQRLHDVERSMVRTAKQHDPATFYRRPSVPGIGKLLSRVLLYELHDIRRVPRVQDVVSYGRLVKGATASAGNRYGASGTKIGNASLKWAGSEAAGFFLRDHPAGQQ